MAIPAALGAVAGAVAGPALDSILDQVSAKQAWDRSKHVSNRQMAAARFLAENQPTWAMQGLRNAGLNPILAATRGMPSAEFAPRIDAPKAGTSQFGSAASSAKQLRTLSPEMEILRETGRLRRLESDAAFYGVGTERARAEREYQAALSEEERVRQMREMTELIRQQQDATAAQAQRTRIGTALDATAMPSAKAAEELYRKYPELRYLNLLLRDVRGDR